MAYRTFIILIQISVTRLEYSYQSRTWGLIITFPNDPSKRKDLDGLRLADLMCAPLLL
jgi:hypothetical protein